MMTFAVMFETEDYEDKDEAVFTILKALDMYQNEVEPRRIHWVDDYTLESD